MTDGTKRRPPLPSAQSFLTCHEIFRGQRTGTTALIGATSHVPVAHFPAHVRLAVYAEFTGGHGRYQPRLCLHDAAREVVWGWAAADPFEYRDPLLPAEVVFNDLTLAVPRPGRYSLVLLLNGQEAAARALWFGPAEAFRPPAAG